MILFSLVAISSASIGRNCGKDNVVVCDSYRRKNIYGEQRITCTKVDKQGYETGSYSFNGASDEKGYFFATLYPSEVEDDCNLAECKAFLESSPLETCNVPTDDNNGVSGCPLDFYRSLSVKKMMLYFVKPLFYTSKPKSISNGY
ncbi:hypothetical protein CK203_051982 [Vitis vinifera]|uniref:Proline-rich protein 3 n=1 Tax=Vitis vinifera TaxID=29760 RepID=A0A438FXX8_VITVI|nr:hypothetical protein CK203_051982 [Vitis vinifera]